jgi:hypothetical protein
MPIRTVPTHPTERRRHWLWALLCVSAGVILLLAGFLAWNWNREVSFRLGGMSFLCGRTPLFAHTVHPTGWSATRRGFVLAVPVPGNDDQFQSPYVVVGSY